MKRIPCMLLCVACFALIGCSDLDSNQSLIKVDNQQMAKDVFNYNLNYNLKTPGANDGASYNVLWTGYDEQYPFPYQQISKENRLNTYLISFEQNVEKYYLVYLSKSVINQSSSWLKKYAEDYKDDLTNYHFVNDSSVVDGKYLLYAQRNNITDYSIYYTEDISSIPFTDINRQLAICLQVKTITIEQNVSAGKEINKTINLLRRYELKYNSWNNILEPYVFDNYEASNVKYVDNQFSYSGKMIKAFDIEIENKDVLYCPYLKTVSANIVDNKVLLPHYVKMNGDYANLLDDDFQSTFYHDDVYRDFKHLFLDAFIEDVDLNNESESYKYAWFDYNKVSQIINDAGGNGK